MADKLSAALEAINKDLKLKVATLADHPVEPLSRLSSGSKSLNDAMGGGWARGRIHELYGPEMSGKTMLSLFAIAEAQKNGELAAFIDMEHALDPEWAAKLGVDVNKMYFTQPDYGEQALEAVNRMVETKKFGVIVVDSIAGLLPKAELEGEIGDFHVGAQARLMGQALRKLVPSVSDSQTVLIFINQLRLKIGVMFGNPETTPGGQALKFWASIRLDARRASKSEMHDDQKNLIGHSIKVVTKKNKTFPPFREAMVPILYNSGIMEADRA